MKRLLWWCICLWVVGSSPVVAGGWWSVAGGQQTVVSGRWSVVGQKTLASGAIDSRQPATGHRPPATNSQTPITSHLPCTDSSPTCLNTLGNLAVQNSRELAVVEQAIQLQKKKLWTHWLNADGLNPLAIGLRIARNIAGGGDRAAAKLEIARLELRRNEVETELHHSILQAVLLYESAERHIHDAQAKWMTHRNRVELLSIAYRLGEGSTETMLQLWQTETELQGEVEKAQLACQQRFVLLQLRVIPSSTSKPIPISQSHK